MLSVLGGLGCSSPMREARGGQSPEDTDAPVWQDTIDKDEPTLYVEVAREQSGILIRWRLCDGAAQSYVDDIVIRPLGTLAVHCMLSRDGTAHARMNSGTWVYGSEHLGYKVEGCTELLPGTAYSATLQGDADGYHQFRVLSDGSVEGTWKQCSGV
jgi:hypothetical protein